ncbi:hypothetical protein L0128_05355 [candidate division KSB1 bacterium]|nr:hypothetical protein [candidate division KSB1 bacterium]
MRTKNWLLWLLALFITLGTAIYQRMTGPTHPVRGKIQLADTSIKYRLLRTHETGQDCPVKLRIADSLLNITLQYKRFKTPDSWTEQPLQFDGQQWVGWLPSQPAAGKLQYQLLIRKGDQCVQLPIAGPVIIRFKGRVPPGVLMPHILIMFFAMLLSNRAGLNAVFAPAKLRSYVGWTLILLFFGGIILGPIVQKYAFGAFWTGYPLGTDLTDNKTAFAFIAWIAAWIAERRGKAARWWVLAAALILLTVYLIPHSLLGSELDYSKIPVDHN